MVVSVLVFVFGAYRCACVEEMFVVSVCLCLASQCACVEEMWSVCAFVSAPISVLVFRRCVSVLVLRRLSVCLCLGPIEVCGQCACVYCLCLLLVFRGLWSVCFCFFFWRGSSRLSFFCQRILLSSIMKATTTE